MKYFKLVLALLLTIGLVFVLSCSEDASQKPLSERTPNIPSADDSPPEERVVVEISGVVDQTEAGLVLISDSGDYLVTGKDLSEVIGKSVVVSGAVEETPGRRTIQVESVRMAE